MVTAVFRAGQRPAFSFFGPFFRTASSVASKTQLERYRKLLKSSEREKVSMIANAYFSDSGKIQFLRDEPEVSHEELLRLLAALKDRVQFPIKPIGETLHDWEEFNHFRKNFTFTNLPYAKKTQNWPDRAALQNLIREKFSKIFQNNSLVVIPGCADGQLPIEVYGNSLKHETPLDIVAADYNIPAMQIGYLTMDSFGLDRKAINWVQADVKSEAFFSWLGDRFPSNSSQQIVTLVQPSLRENSFLQLLKNNGTLHRCKQVPSKIYMPILLEEPDSEWLLECDQAVRDAEAVSRKRRSNPKLIWNFTKYGRELLRLSRSEDNYVPQQYFIKSSALSEIRTETGYEDLSSELFDAVSQLEYLGPGDPLVVEKSSLRLICVWGVKD